LSLREWAAIAVAFCGVALIFAEDFSALGGRQVAVASAVMLASPLSSAVGGLSVKRWGAGIHPFSLTAVPMALAALVMAAAALAFERGRAIVWNPQSVSALFYLAVLGSALTFSLYYWLLARMTLKRLAFITNVIPVIAVFVGVIRGEPLTVRILTGSAVVVAGLALAVKRSGP
jgi:drug/metabolite transporter (DMT)-like permease